MTGPTTASSRRSATVPPCRERLKAVQDEALGPRRDGDARALHRLGGGERPDVPQDARQRRPHVRVHRARHSVDVLADQRAAACPTVPAPPPRRTRCTRSSTPRSAGTPTPTRATSTTSRTTSRPRPSSAIPSDVPAPAQGPPLPGPLPGAVVRPALPGPRGPVGDARDRPAGCAGSAASCCSSTARTTRGAPSASRPGRWTRDTYVYEVAGGTHTANITQLPQAEEDQATATVRRWAGRRAAAPPAAQRQAGTEPEDEPAVTGARP